MQIVNLIKFYPHPKRAGIRRYLHFNLKFNWKILFVGEEEPLKNITAQKRRTSRKFYTAPKENRRRHCE